MRCALVALAAGAITLTAGASVVYENEASFLTAIQAGYYLEEFDGYTYGSYQGDTLNLSQGGWAYTISADGPVNSTLYSGDGNMSTNNATDWLRVDFTGDPVTAVGGWFFAGDIGGYYIPGPMIIELSDGTYYEFDPVNTTDFRGFTTSEPITWMTIEATDVGGVPAWATMDHFYVGAVPAPGVLALLGLAGLVRSRRR